MSEEWIFILSITVIFTIFTLLIILYICMFICWIMMQQFWNLDIFFQKKIKICCITKFDKKSYENDLLRKILKFQYIFSKKIQILKHRYLENY